MFRQHVVKWAELGQNCCG